MLSDKALYVYRNLFLISFLSLITFLLFQFFSGARTTPSVVAFSEDATRHVGDVAKRQVSNLDPSGFLGALQPMVSFALFKI